ncbi:conserved hypothetical protein [Lodderomyces elongisporus NRRL YB-4239]|uniref:Cation efflux protein transmembrane domain-containing protein n=1 Tax=Lodderomyces elongisporus (strain ATCC 11503 / CBS 2605 / JCM 1781 / NBRC 1676 / NRRL YB-4239) TaxID=379508 RepID=A5E0S2_LODEL|nr:conserved hypothetical protein [Lodderomyces elongisporus NRRL YB-4239]
MSEVDPKETLPLNPSGKESYDSLHNDIQRYSPQRSNKGSASTTNLLHHAKHSSSSLTSVAASSPPRPPSAPPIAPPGSTNLRRPPSGNALSNLPNSGYTEFGEFGCPKRRYSLSVNEFGKLSPERPLYHRLLSSHHSVTNPASPFETSLINTNKSTPQLAHTFFSHQDASTSSFIPDSALFERRRMSIIDIVNNLRPSRLIGNMKPLYNWYASYNDDTDNIKNKAIRKYYEEQNFLITKYQEIDNFLDAGKIHYNMLSNYSNDGSNKVALDNIEEMDETLKIKSKNGSVDNPKAKTRQTSLAADQPNGTDHRQNGPVSTSGNGNGIGNGNVAGAGAGAGAVLGAEMIENMTSPDDLELGPKEPSLSKYTRFYDVPGNVDNDGGKFLGFNHEEDGAQVLKAILVNFFINVVLLIGKVIVALLTSSLSVAASLVDSILDFLSTFIIYIVNRLASQNDWKVEHSYPVGRSRLEPLGVLIFSIIIIISFFQVGQESFKRLFFSTPEQRVAATIGPDAVAIMGITIVAKLGCWIWCSKSQSSSVQALAQDAMTDVVFNTVSLLMPWLGHLWDIWWFDPLGALLLSVYIIFNWGKTAFEHINNLTGAVADPLEYKVVLYMALRFAEPIKQITALKVYHVGDNLNVEIDVVFANDKFNLTFKDCHDIAEALQYSIESLPMVERAFVHIDYMEGNFKGHLK